MRRRRDDVSDLPAATREHDGHTHPLPRGFRLLLAVYGIVLGLTLGALIFSLMQERQTSQIADARRDAAIAREFDRRTEARDALDEQLRDEIEAQEVRTREAVCAVLTSGDLGPSPRIDALARELRCG